MSDGNEVQSPQTHTISLSTAQATALVAGAFGQDVSVDDVQTHLDAEPQGSGLNYEDSWDKPGAAQQPADAPNADPFDRYRSGRGHALEVPQTAHSARWDDGSLADFGRAAAHSGLPQPLAQTLVGMYAESAEQLPEYGFDQQQTVSQLRAEWGEQLESNLAHIERFVNQRPALAAWLDSTGMGDSPAVLRLLAGAARTPEILSPAKAQAYIDKVMGNMEDPYWKGDKTALATMRVAYAVIG